MALAQLRALSDPDAGHDERLPELAGRFSTFLASGGTLIGNFGAANVNAGLRAASAGLREAGFIGTRVGVVRGDDVREQAIKEDLQLPELGLRISDLGSRFVSAHAYIGAEPIIDLLDSGARVIIGGRIADPSLFVAPICFALGWSLDDPDRAAQATLVGHILECGPHVTGGNFADPPYRAVSNPHDLGQPYARVSSEDAFISKDPASGGLVSVQTVSSQMGYEIHDPASYITPDVTADFSQVWARAAGTDCVQVGGALGRKRPETLKVLVGLDYGWKSIGEVSFGGPGCVSRAELAADTIRQRLTPIAGEIDEIRFDLHGLTALFGRELWANGEPPEVRLRVAARCQTMQAAQRVNDEVEFMYMGPAGAAGISLSKSRSIGVTPAFIARSRIDITTETVIVR